MTDTLTSEPRDGWHTYYVLGTSDDVLTALAEAAPTDEPTASGPHVVYWQVPEGQTLKTPFAKLLASRRFAPSTTYRNARTMAKVAARL